MSAGRDDDLRWRAFRAELLRTTGTRSFLVPAGLAVALPALFTALFMATSGQPGGPALETRPGVLTVLTPGSSAALLAAIIGALTVAAEFRHGTAASSVVLVGSRRLWMGSKALVAISVGAIVGLLGQLATLLIALPWLVARGVEVGDFVGPIVATSVALPLAGALSGLWGFGLALIVPNEVGVVAGLVVFTTLVESIVIEFVPAVGRFLPSGALAAIASDVTISDRLPIGLAIAVYVLWAAAASLIGSRVMSRREI